jgi:hypothetical protein
VLRFSLAALAAWIALEAARRALRDPAGRARALRIAALVLLLSVVADLGAFFLRTVRPVSAEALYPSTPAIDFLRSERRHGRFARVSADREQAIGEVHVLLPPNMGLVHGLADAQGYRELVPWRYLLLLEGAAARTSDVGMAGFALAEAASPVLDVISARWLVAAGPLEDAPAFAASGLRRVAVPGGPESRPAARDLVVYENPDALPLASVVFRADVMSDAEALGAIRSGELDAPRRVALDRAPREAVPPPSALPSGNVAAVRIEPGTIGVDATLSEPGYVLINESWDPGWRARLWHGPWEEDRGGELEVLRANVAFMAVPVPAGHHTIRLAYWPRWLTAGIVAACAGAATLLVWTAWPARRRRPVARPDAAPFGEQGTPLP